MIDNHSKVFWDIPKGFPPNWDHDHVINFPLGSVQPNIIPYKYPYAQKTNIQNMVQVRLDANTIQHNQGDLFSLVDGFLKGMLMEYASKI